jgi:hypothetical protein
MELTKRDRRAMIFGGAGLAVILIYLWMIEPMLNRYDELTAEHDRLSARAASLLGDERAKPAMEKYIGECESKVGPMAVPGVYSNEITQVGDRIMTAGQCGVQIKNTRWISPRPWFDDPKLSMAMVQIDCEGQWESVCKFLAALYRTEGIFSVEQMDMTGDAQKGGMVTMKLTVSVIVQSATQEQGTRTR